MAYSNPSNARAAAKTILAKVSEDDVKKHGLKVGTPARLPTGGMALYHAIISTTSALKDIPEALGALINEKGKLVEDDGGDDTSTEDAAPAKRPGRKAPAKKAKAKPKSKKSNDGERVNKTATALKLMSRANGVKATELIDTFEWLPHTLRGFVSLTNKKRREAGETEIATERKNGVTTYIIKG
jgi:hypothetical protein